MSLAVGSQHVCVLLADSNVICWGDNGDGALGIGNRSSVGMAAGQMGNALKPVDLGAGVCAALPSPVHLSTSNRHLPHP